MTGARGRHAEGIEEVARELLAKVAGVLDGIVEVDLGEAVKTLAGSEFVEIQGEGRLGIDRLKGKGAFEMKGDVGVTRGAFVNGHANVNALRARLFPDLMILLQNRHAFRRNLDAEAGDGCTRQEVIGGFAGRKGGVGQAQKAKKD